MHVEIKILTTQRLFITKGLESTDEIRTAIPNSETYLIDFGLVSIEMEDLSCFYCNYNISANAFYRLFRYRKI